MRMVQQHLENDQVYVRTDAGTYMDTPGNFASDYGTAIPTLPAGITERIYEPGKRHALIRDADVVAGGPMPWPEGDAILQAYESMVAAQKAREAQYAAANVNQ